ncbi:MAG TPA: aldo/keto reductase [Acidimicrobiales bacterium]|nr:aldo/keto reductase [Acidimicrobiales bacterium]
MEYRDFGKTGLQVSLCGLGSGGASRLGLAYGSTEEQAIAVIHRALELGINYFDTAENYANEAVVGRGLAGHRDEVVLSTKVGPRTADDVLLTAKELRAAVELALEKLGTDRVDVFHLHRLRASDFDYFTAELAPELECLRDAGKLRFTGVSESTGDDPEHLMLQRAVAEDLFDVVMVGFTFFNQSARDKVFPAAIAHGTAVEIMASARTQFSQAELLAKEITERIASGEVDADGIDLAAPLDFLIGPGRATSVAEASYRFAAHEPGVHTVLVGTGKIDHLEENVVSLNAGPLPGDVTEVLVEAFGHLASAVFVPGRPVAKWA